ncbi:electron transfer flavoprotein subunit beta/FixA family protein [Arthrobacter burdickii]|uniref:Electron transfer flavoprotein subunit beta n=1 Tax=Arthrobacter burdickii TaxID=3035920 RepID=A0ABT8K1D1_9MICC|nr:electron transfer flavoprotein subunit beta/FixA family protein [Arthrobacter burdickii]MDN4611007.1 electron transfer flavoprotein subunit beta/FixA family protein [Arthrobacter burdickii]
MDEAPAPGLRIAVLVKHVPDAQFDRHISSDDLTTVRAESILSELDEYALEAALQLVEAHGGAAAGHRVTAITMGPAAAVGAVKKSLQIGAHDGVHLTDEALRGSDASATSRALAALLQHAGPFDLVLTGMASTDGETSLVPAQLAERLALPQVTFAASLDLTREDSGWKLAARRDNDTFAETIEAPLPALVSVTDQINEPRYPNFKGIMAAKKKQIQVLSLADVGLQPDQVGFAGSWTRIEAAAPRPPRSQGIVITDEGDAGIRLVDFLAGQKLL